MTIITVQLMHDRAVGGWVASHDGPSEEHPHGGVRQLYDAPAFDDDEHLRWAVDTIAKEDEYTPITAWAKRNGIWERQFEYHTMQDTLDELNEAGLVVLTNKYSPGQFGLPAPCYVLAEFAPDEHNPACRCPACVSSA